MTTQIKWNFLNIIFVQLLPKGANKLIQTIFKKKHRGMFVVTKISKKCVYAKR